MIIDCIADAHGHYPKLEGGDLLIVAGDLTSEDTIIQHDQVYYRLKAAPYKKVVVVAGNHDGCIQRQDYCYESPCGKVAYLCDSGTEIFYSIQEPELTDDSFNPSATVIKKLKIFGSPWTLAFEGMNPKCKAFTVDTEEELAEKWAMIPDDVDILVTHSPRLGTFDQIQDYCTGKIECVGSFTLAAKIGSLRNLKLHVCGHIHEGYGMQVPVKEYRPGFIDVSSFTSVNASHVNEHYEPVNKPIRVVL